MELAEYIRVGDEVSIMWRSTALTGCSGTVVNIGPGEYGRRTLAICKQGDDLADDGAITVPENQAVFSVRRGDSWVDVPLPFLPEEATLKVRRNLENHRKRIHKAAPLFADLIEPKPRFNEGSCNPSGEAQEITAKYRRDGVNAGTRVANGTE
jgi:hypothetical protein